MSALIWRATGKLTPAWAVLLVLQGLLPAAAVYITRPLVDNLVTALGASASWETVRPALMLAVALGVVLVLIEVVQSVNSWVRTAQAELIRDHLNFLIHKKSVAADISFYESPEYYARLEQARNDLSSRPLVLLENGGALLQNLVTLVAMSVLLMPYGIWLPFMLALSTAPALLVVLKSNDRYYRWWSRRTGDRRMAQYYDGLLTSGAVAAELRMFDLGGYFQSAYQRLRAVLRIERLRLLTAQLVGRLFAAIFALAIAALLMAWMMWRVLHGHATLGELALFYQAFSQGQGLLRSLLENAGQIYSNGLFLENLFGFLALNPVVVDASEPLPAPTALNDAIRFENVNFSYPGADTPVLQDFNLTIRAGEIVALVGANGAGKSTVLKLLCRFYDPQKGRITLDGIDIRRLSIAELRRLITVLFQLPVTYQTTAAENIAFGDLSANVDRKAIESAAHCAGAHEFIARLADGYDSRLGRWFSNGTELSVGEWQKIALARAFIRRAEIILLDEPTSALDSWSEVEWFDRFRALAQAKSALIITHRLTIARHADVIHVLDAGKIVESGTHDQLLARGTRYASSWFAQVRERTNGSELNVQEELFRAQNYKRRFTISV